MRLSAAAVDRLRAEVERPGYDRDGQGEGIVHLGIGAFHRAHQAVYTDAAMAAGDRDMRIVGVSLMSPTARDALAPQDGLYTVTERCNGAATTRLVGAVSRVLVGPEDPEGVVAVLAAPTTRVVTLTVTEKGYYRDLATGGLDRGDARIAADLGGAAPVTIHGFLARALARRRASGAGGLTLVSCDNLSGNGALLAALLDEFLRDGDPALADWVAATCACPDTMVDRIVPAATDADRAEMADRLGVEDHGAIATEPFRQWVIEDRFAGPRPRWDAGGAQFVADVRPFELAKLRLLNASHSTLAYLGLQRGHIFVHEAVGDAALLGFVRRQALDEAVPTLAAAPGLDPAAYVEAVLTRFANADVRHRLDQIATDGSQKVPQRWIATILERAATGQDSACLVASLAAWLGFMRGTTPDGRPMPVRDPLAVVLAAAWAQSPDAATVVDRAVVAGVFPAALGDDDATRQRLAVALARWISGGVAALLEGIGDP